VVQSVKWKTNVKLPYKLPGKKFMGSLEDDVIEERKVGLRQYLKGSLHTTTTHRARARTHTHTHTVL
jgi:hypothetical protein